MKEHIKDDLLQSCYGLTVNHNCWSPSKLARVLYPMPVVIGVTVHNAGTPKNPNAKNLTQAMQNNAETCWHFSVDENGAWQGLPLNYNGWHCSDGASGTGNRKTIAIEICRDMYNTDNSDKWEASKRNGAKLTAILLNEYGLTINDVYTHQHWARDKKYCPHHILDEGWNKFLALVQEELDSIQHKNHAVESALYRVQVGAYSKKANAEDLAKKLKEAGFSAYIVNINNLYKVQTGAYSKKENAVAQMNKLKEKGYNGFIVMPATESKPSEGENDMTVKFVRRSILGNFKSTSYYKFAKNRTGIAMPNCFTYSTGRLSEALEKNVILDTKKRVIGAQDMWNDNYRNPDLIKVSSPQPGDLIIWKNGPIIEGRQYGHIANVEAVNGDKVSWTESNYGGAEFAYITGNPATHYSYCSLKLAGYLRHKDWKDFDTNTNKKRKASANVSAPAVNTSKTTKICGYDCIPENGTATFKYSVNVRDGSPTGKVVATYDPGEYVNYQYKYIGNGHRYVVYKSASGRWRFVAVSGTEKQGEDPWATFK